MYVVPFLSWSRHRVGISKVKYLRGVWCLANENPLSAPEFLVPAQHCNLLAICNGMVMVEPLHLAVLL